MTMIKGPVRLYGAMLLAWALLAQAAWAQGGPTRIVVVPFYTEQGRPVTDGGFEGIHYERVLGYINNHLVGHGFEVIDPAAHEYTEAEYSRLRERPREDSLLAAKELTARFLVDVVYLVWLDVTTHVTDDHYCKARVQVQGKGYDSAARSIGASLVKIWNRSRRNCDDAVITAEKEIGDEIGRLLTASRKKAQKRKVDDSGGDGVVQRTSDELAVLINVRLDEATRWELVDVFGRVLTIVRGSVDTKPYGMNIDPENPGKSFIAWRIRIENTDAFRLQANIMTLLERIYEAGGQGNFNGVQFRFTSDEVNLLKAIRPDSMKSRSIIFLVDRDRAQAIEFSSGYD